MIVVSSAWRSSSIPFESLQLQVAAITIVRLRRGMKNSGFVANPSLSVINRSVLAYSVGRLSATDGMIVAFMPNILRIRCFKPTASIVSRVITAMLTVCIPDINYWLMMPFSMQPQEDKEYGCGYGCSDGCLSQSLLLRKVRLGIGCGRNRRADG